ncbi:MAG: twin-arginine translocation signal domain-containing protein, partial [Acidaminococcaceae bacterium]|nr:twin-arginine translocation signal domain-containing protein [Acidaminococcaceae bacterium]
MAVSRRDFLKGLAVGGTTGYFAMAGLSSTVMKDMFVPEEPVGDVEIGEVKVPAGVGDAPGVLGDAQQLQPLFGGRKRHLIDGAVG